MIRWCYAFVDRPVAGYERAVRFWAAVADASVSAPHGDTGEFATLLPATGDAGRVPPGGNERQAAAS
jgi:hypothetical protein